MNIVLIGTGKVYSEHIQFYLRDPINIIEVWDNDEKKQGKKTEEGYSICKPHSLDISVDKYVILIRKKEQVIEQLHEMGITDEEIGDSFFIYRLFLETNYNRLIKIGAVIPHDERTTLRYIESHGLTVFFYKNADMWNNNAVSVFRDNKYCLPYVEENGHRMYFPKNYEDSDVVRYCNSIYKEQDECSPHCYRIEADNDEYDIVIDAGGAEGYFALHYVDRTAKIYVIESDKKWTDLYQYTFDKEILKSDVECIKKNLGDIDDDETITIDYLYENYIGNVINKKILLKMDIEGAEERALNGANHFLKSENDIRMVICVYHHFDEADRIKKLIEDKYNYSTSFSESYMFFPPSYEKNTVDKPKEYLNNDLFNYRLRKGVLYAHNSI